jgi:hypothetical protein
MVDRLTAAPRVAVADYGRVSTNEIRHHAARGEPELLLLKANHERLGG